MINGKDQASVYARGYNMSKEDGLDLKVLDESRRMIERLNSFGGFLYLHATGGGTGQVYFQR